jgi:hypothetical protein
MAIVNNHLIGLKENSHYQQKVDMSINLTIQSLNRNLNIQVS